MQRKYRLTHRRAFNYVYKHGKSVSNSNMTLVYTTTKFGKKFGFSISRKVGKAVVRNKIKRRLKSGLLPMINSIDSGYNYIFVVKPSSAQLTYDELIASATALLEKARKLNGET